MAFVFPSVTFNTSGGATLWILASAFSVAAGWILSALGQLNLVGYLPFGILFIAFVLWLIKKYHVWPQVRPSLLKTRYFTGKRLPLRVRALPQIYFLYLALSLAGGIAHPPNSYDAVTYRLPRILHWAAEEQWHWITTLNQRMNYSGTGSEWLLLPWLKLTQSDRLLFLANWIPYLLLPGLIFSIFLKAGVRRRAAWRWMWLLPASYCFVMQAGGANNDASSAIYLLGAVFFALRANQTGRFFDFSLAILAAALLTGVKGSNLPLLLPCAVALWPARRLLWEKPKTTAVVMVLAALISFLPIAILNHQFSGHWTGDKENLSGMRLSHPAAGLIGNTLQLLPQTFLPPILPNSRSLETTLNAQVPTNIKTFLEGYFPRFEIMLGELPQEENAGLGLGIAALLILAMLSPLLLRTGNRAVMSKLSMGVILGLAAWGALLFYMTKMGSEATARLLSPYYPLAILLVVLHPANGQLARQRWWYNVAALCALFALPGLLLTPSRPLVPTATLVRLLRASQPDSPMLQRAERVYFVYGHRHDILAPLRKHLPENVKTVGIISGIDDSQLALWRPYGTRRVQELVGEAVWFREGTNFLWIVVKHETLCEANGVDFQEWLSRTGAELIATENIASKVSAGDELWSLVKLTD